MEPCIKLSAKPMTRIATAPIAPAAGNRDGTWSVEMPVEEVPPELPEPCPGVNFARDGMQKRDWLALVAVHSDAWLLAVAFFYAANLDSTGRCVTGGPHASRAMTACMIQVHGLDAPCTLSAPRIPVPACRAGRSCTRRSTAARRCLKS